MKILLAYVLIGALTGQGEPINAPDTFRISGQIDAAFVERMKVGVTDSTKWVSVESAGGEEAKAIEAAELLLSRGISVRVERYCLSACSLYLLAAAKKVEVAPGAIVGFHAPALGTAQILREAMPDTDQTKEIDGVARKSIALYQKAHKNPKLLIDAFYAADVDCLLLIKEGERISSARIRNAVDVWTPSRERLAAYGWTVEGYWPRSQEEETQISKAYLKEDALVRFGDEYAAPRKPDITVSSSGCPPKRETFK
jgi:hypothetical protein